MTVTPWAAMRAALVTLCVCATACTRGNERPSTADTPQGAAVGGESGVSTGQVTIEFRSDPNPPRSGDNALQVRVTQPDGSPVTDAAVTAVFSMPAMPAMNMPAMRSDAALTHVGDGRYEGTGQLSMGGTWTVAVRAARGDTELGTRRFSIVAR